MILVRFKNIFQVGCLRDLSKEDIIAFYKQFIEDSENRRKLSCHVVSTCEGGAGTCEAEAASGDSGSCRVISDITGFKSSLPLYPLARPFVDPSSLKRPDQ